VNTKDLTHYKSIDLNSYHGNNSIDNDELTSINETRHKKYKKRPKMTELLNMMHCQAKLIEENLVKNF
jgi:hypothetical protein